MKTVHVTPNFLLKHLAGIRPLASQASSFKSVIPSGASIKLKYIGKSGSSHEFKATISSYQNWRINGDIYKLIGSANNKVVILSGTLFFNYRDSLKRQSNYQSFWRSVF